MQSHTVLLYAKMESTVLTTLPLLQNPLAWANKHGFLCTLGILRGHNTKISSRHVWVIHNYADYINFIIVT